MHNLAPHTSYLRMQIDVNTVVSFWHLFIASAIDCVVNQYFLHYYTNNFYHGKNKSSHCRDSRPFIFHIIKRNSKGKKVVFYLLSGPVSNGTPMIGPIEAPIRNEQGPFHDGLRLAPEMRETFNKKCFQFCAMCMVHPIHFTMLSIEKLKQHFSQDILFTITSHNTSYEERYIIEFKPDYYLNTKYDLEVQLPHIGRLAYHNRKRYRITQHRLDWITVSLFLSSTCMFGYYKKSYTLNDTHHLMPSSDHIMSM